VKKPTANAKEIITLSPVLFYVETKIEAFKAIGIFKRPKMLCLKVRFFDCVHNQLCSVCCNPSDHRMINYGI
jgi:hypothetical protein